MPPKSKLIPAPLQTKNRRHIHRRQNAVSSYAADPLRSTAVLTLLQRQRQQQQQQSRITTLNEFEEGDEKEKGPADEEEDLGEEEEEEQQQQDKQLVSSNETSKEGGGEESLEIEKKDDTNLAASSFTPSLSQKQEGHAVVASGSDSQSSWIKSMYKNYSTYASEIAPRLYKKFLITFQEVWTKFRKSNARAQSIPSSSSTHVVTTPKTNTPFSYVDVTVTREQQQPVDVAVTKEQQQLSHNNNKTKFLQLVYHYLWQEAIVENLIVIWEFVTFYWWIPLQQKQLHRETPTFLIALFSGLLFLHFSGYIHLIVYVVLLLNALGLVTQQQGQTQGQTQEQELEEAKSRKATTVMSSLPFLPVQLLYIWIAWTFLTLGGVLFSFPFTYQLMCVLILFLRSRNVIHLQERQREDTSQ